MKRTAYVRPLDFTYKLAEWHEKEQKARREKAVAAYTAECGNPPDESLDVDKIERIVENRQKARRLQVIARRSGTAVSPLKEPTSMPINGVNVLIPGGIQLYSSQKLMLVRIMQCLNAVPPNAALIESATGSGKTIALLSGVCGWMVQYNRKLEEKKKACKAHGTDEDGNHTCDCPKPTRVFYCTKTFAQLSQVVEEYSKLPYYKEGKLRHTVLAGRDKLCVNDKVLKSCGGNANAVTLRCQSKLQSKGGGCRQFTELQRRYGKKPAELRQDVRSQLMPEKAFDIEDLHKALGGLKDGAVCPYFAATDLLFAKADIVFCVYPYVFDPSVRSVKNIDLSGAIVVVDEGHNLLDVGCEALTFDAQLFRLHELSSEILKCVFSAQALIEEYEPNADLAAEMLEAAKSRYAGVGMMGKCVTLLYSWCIQQLEDNWAAKKDAFHGRSKLVHTLETETFHSTLRALYFESSDDPQAELVPLEHLRVGYAQFKDLAEGKAVCLTSEDNVKTRPQMSSMDVLRKLFNFIFYYKGDPTQFRCTFEMKLDRCGVMNDSVFAQYVKESQNCSVRLWPLTASTCLNDIAKDMRAMIVVSGTLSPPEMFESQFGIKFGIKELRLPSVVPQENIFAAALSRGPNGKPIDGRFDNARDPNSDFYIEVASTIASACSIVPDGIVCFFGSYTILENTAAVLKSNKYCAFYSKYKRLFTETATSNSKTTMERYKEALDQGDGALLFAVFRGCISEGINLSHYLARCTIIVGIPFPNASDEYVRVRSEALGGYEWSALHAYLAVNQALGRSLRNKSDWSAFLLLDKRFADERQNKRLSSWAHSRLKVYDDEDKRPEFTPPHLCPGDLKKFCLQFGPLATLLIPTADSRRS